MPYYGPLKASIVYNLKFFTFSFPGYRLRRFKILGSIHSFDTRDFNDYVYDFTHNFGLELCAEQIDSVQDGDTVQYTCSHMKAR